MPSDPPNACPCCGAPRPDEGNCPDCGAGEPVGSAPREAVLAAESETGSGGSGLRVLPPAQPSGAPVRAEVRLVRELKGPTVRGLIGSSPAVIQRLPGRMLGSLQALRRGDLADAEQRFDDAVGQILEGPWAGEHHRWRRRHVLWPSALLVLASILLVLATWLLA